MFRPGHFPLPHMVACMKVAEDAGFDHIWFGDSHLIWHEVGPYLAAAAIFGGVVALFYYPGRIGPAAIVLKSQALSIKVRPFIDAARVAGGSNGHIIFRHIVPNLLPLSFLYMMFTVTTAIALEATLSFFGLLDVPMSWGIMIHTAQVGGYLLRGTEYWWLLLPAGAAVTFFAAAFYFVGRALDEVVNPRLRRR